MMLLSLNDVSKMSGWWFPQTLFAFSALMLLVGRSVKTERWGAGVVICLERGADLYMAQLMPLPLTVSCFCQMQIVFTFLVLAHLASPGKGPLNGCCCCFRELIGNATLSAIDTMMPLQWQLDFSSAEVCNCAYMTNCR